MKLEEVTIGMRVLSRSYGFTGGWYGRVTEKRRHPSHQDCVFVEWDNGMTTAVAVELVEPEILF